MDKSTDATHAHETPQSVDQTFAAQAVASAVELGDQTLAALKQQLGKNLLRLSRLPDGLEQEFRADYRSRATAVVRSSVYGLVALYLLVVLPVAFFVEAPMQALWRTLAVYPIGLALLIIWLCSSFFSRYTEFSLRFGTFLSLLGPTCGFLALGDSLLGKVAGCETIYVLIVVFTLLMLRITDVLGWALAALTLALMASLTLHWVISWINIFLYFLVPLLICVVTGYLLEYVARRNFVQALLHQQDRLRVVNYMASLISDVDDMGTVLTLALERVCNHNGWLLGRVTAVDRVDLAAPVVYAHADLEALLPRHEGLLWCEPASALFAQVVEQGMPCWMGCLHELKDERSDRLWSLHQHLIFPIKLDNRVLAVLEFYAEQAEQPDQRLLSLMDNVGLQLGRVFEHAGQKRELKHKAMHDALTGLPNRAYLFEHLAMEMARAKRHQEDTFCVLFVDADHFKWVNDSLGHLAGDQLLIDLSRRLRRCVRASDFVARLGGDEFAIVIRVLEDSERIATTIECIRQRLLQPFLIASQDILLGLSVGVVMYDASYTEPEELLRDADTAMYAAKKRGRGRFEVFNLDMHEQMVARLRLSAELRTALEAQQFVLHYQPVVDARQGRVTGFEALMRWQHPDRGLVPPGHFIPLAEENGVILPLTDWALRQACQQLRLWQQAGDDATCISVNLCASYLAQPDMPDKVLAIAEAAGISPETLHLEITESQVMVNADICMTNISRLRDLGFAIYIDDFGTGYSSLNYLANFRVNALKIDKSFLDQMEAGGKEMHIVQIIIDLAHQLDLSVIAEGVETQAQLARLRDMGCDFIQGYVYSKPVPAQLASDMVRRQLHEEAGLFQKYTVAG